MATAHRLSLPEAAIHQRNSPVLNMLYRHLLTAGRCKADKNTLMYSYWSARRSEREGLGPNPSEIAKECGVTIYAARAAVLHYRRGRVPTNSGSGLAPKTGWSLVVIATRLDLGPS
jgi:hypothetical protein